MNTDKQFYILMGKPGSGKGTQAELLQKKLQESHADVMHITTGGAFREFIKADGFVSSQARNLQNSGGLQPEFLAIWIWAGVFIQSIKENTTVILDGAPRKVIETEALHDVFPFLGYPYPHVIHIDVSDDWARDRQKFRQAQSVEKRPDTESDAEITKRLALFQKDIVPCIEVFKHDSRYTFTRINGEQSVEEVHQAILATLGLV